MLICHPFLSLIYILVRPIKFCNCGKFFSFYFFVLDVNILKAKKWRYWYIEVKCFHNNSKEIDSSGIGLGLFRVWQRNWQESGKMATHVMQYGNIWLNFWMKILGRLRCLKLVVIWHIYKANTRNNKLRKDLYHTVCKGTWRI